jgi:hypothetical protein
VLLVHRVPERPRILALEERSQPGGVGGDPALRARCRDRERVLLADIADVEVHLTQQTLACRATLELVEQHLREGVDLGHCAVAEAHEPGA